jgi:hypothetical protein
MSLTPNGLNRPAPKGQQDSAQGFNPGYGAPIGCALKVAPERVRRWCGIHEFNTPHQVWRPFRAHHVKTLYPGLKPWAESCRPFGAVNDEDDKPGSNPHR